MKFDNSFFEEEIRDGFYVPAIMKRVWAAELEVLSEIDRICRKHNIEYTADWGTLLGAIRHGGFIPWDDDLDICMKRADYIRFLKIAPRELTGGMDVYTYRNHDDFWSFVARVVSKRQICFDEEHLQRFHQFPYMCGVDIYVLDYVCRDSEREENRVNVAKYVIEVADMLSDCELNKDDFYQHLNKICEICNFSIPSELNICDNENDSTENRALLRKKLYGLAEELFGLFDAEESDVLTRMMPNGLYGGGVRLPKEFYDDIVYVPFENMKIPVPMGYDEMLRLRYGNYMTWVKDAGGHGYPFFAIQQNKLKNILEKNGIKIPGIYEITLDEFNILQCKKNSRKKFSDIVKEQYEVLSKTFNAIFYDDNFSIDMLIEAQQRAIDLGNTIEARFDEDSYIIKKIELLCENLYNIVQSKVDGKADVYIYVESTRKLLSKIQGIIEEEILVLQEIVFIITDISQWKNIKTLWQKECDRDNTRVYVLPLSVYYKKYDGSIYEMVNKLDGRIKEINGIDESNYDISIRKPDRIYIQNPYDEYNPVYTVEKKYYSSNLIKYTHELFYIQPFIVEEFSKDNYREYYNMQYYCTMPGVINADKVYVQSENMKQLSSRRLFEPLETVDFTQCH